MGIQSYQELEVWRLGMEIAKGIYKATAELPREEVYGLASQMRRAAVSIPSNIAEGQQRQYRKEFVQFLYQAMGSLSELKTQLILAQDIHGLAVEDEFRSELDVLGKKLRRLIQSLSTNHQPPITNHQNG